ncbi:MAG: N-acetylneuraminate synthase family protein, partial [Candidatus Omnitrophica bacterium]|nr:N-acetylneuraminate synthase family protein [Candidatus Omnitrophota bacterium]
MNPRIKIKNYEIAQNQPCFIIAEIGHNHQGNLKVALDMIKSAADCGVNAVKFQKRNNKVLYTKSIYNMPYDNEDSFGVTYGEHREFLEFNWDEYVALKECAKKNGVEFMCTAFDFESVDFLEKLGINS